MVQTGRPAPASAAQARPQADTPLAPTPSPPAGPFVVRIVDLDYQMVRPVPGLDVCYSSLAGEAVDRVPVVRIFGATPAGQKCCVHLHRVSGHAAGNALCCAAEGPRRNSSLLAVTMHAHDAFGPFVAMPVVAQLPENN